VNFTEEIRTGWRILTFRATAEEFRSLNRRHLILGLVCTWIVGIGRWWEDPRAGWVQHLGVGSVAYVFVLALFLWLVLWPLNPPRWSYFNVLTFVSLTSSPAILYALPVRHGLGLQNGQIVRLWMLAVVAGWRVALLAFYLCRGAGLSGLRTLMGTLFPLAVIVFTLTLLNLDKVVFDIMGGIAESDRSVNDAAYGVLMLLSALSFYLSLPLLIAYAALCVQGIRERLRSRDVVQTT
jgi:hypothetical protein